MPGKAAYLALESDPELDFAHYLAEKLGVFVIDLDDMPHDEFVRWSRYYARKAQARQLAERQAARA